MTNPIPEHPGLPAEIRERMAVIGSPITYMEHVSHGKHQRAPHLVYVADRVLEKLRLGNPMGQLAEVGDQQFLATFIPVRHAKSTFLGLYLATWLMGMFPGIKILFVTYSDDRAAKWGGDARDLMRMFGPTLFNTSVRRDRESSNFWATSNGSEMRSVGIGGPIVGEGFHVVIIDDTIKNPEEADSPTTKRKQVEWYYETLRNRLEPGGLMLFSMARWREDDLPGQVCVPASDEEVGLVDEWEVVRLPAIAEAPTPPDPEINPFEVPYIPDDWTEDAEAWVEKWRREVIDEAIDRFREEWRDELGRKDGDPLWPQKWPRRVLERLRSGLLGRGQSTAWEALYQQNPSPKEGGAFKVDMWRKIGRAPELRAAVRAWDLSASLRKGDYTVGVKMGLGFNNEVYVLNVARDRLDPAGVQNLVVLTAEQDGPTVAIGMEEEKGASGKANSAVFAQKLMGYIFRPEPVSGSKDVRAAGYAAHQGNGLVYLVADGTWDVDSFIEEHRTFGAGRNDDQVDAASLAFRMLALGGYQPAAAEYVMPEDDLTPIARRARRRDPNYEPDAADALMAAWESGEWEDDEVFAG